MNALQKLLVIIYLRQNNIDLSTIKINLKKKKLKYWIYKLLNFFTVVIFLLMLLNKIKLIQLLHPGYSFRKALSGSLLDEDLETEMK